MALYIFNLEAVLLVVGESEGTVIPLVEKKTTMFNT